MLWVQAKGCHMDWTEETIARLRALWDEGHSTAEIGRRMGITKNAVVGKAHRLNLPARPSPIRREAHAPRATPRRQPTPRPAQPAFRRPLPAPAPRPVVVAPTPISASGGAVIRPFPRLTNRDCCWPMGDPGTPNFRFCTAEPLGGKPYCAEHAAVAYVKARDRREDAA
jgi:GcrA cell cycle regulator